MGILTHRVYRQSVVVLIAAFWMTCAGCTLNRSLQRAQRAMPAPQYADGGQRASEPRAEADSSATVGFEKVVLDSTATRPNELDVAYDGRVFYIEREGAVKVWRPETGRTEMVGFIPVNAIHTSGLLGMTLDPEFEKNSWIYLYFSPIGDDAHNVLARFTIADNRIVPATKRVVLKVPTVRHILGGAHSAGSLTFGPDGNLFLSTGDKTSPTEVELSTPIDERPGREHWDAQRTAGNTMSLEGKVLRIRPLPDGGYEIPAGNLFPYGAVGRPEIYAMGMRNPFRIAVDPATGWLYWGDVGPGAYESEKRGAQGHDEFNQAKEPGFYGWPYFVADNKPFRDYDFATGESGPFFDPEKPINESPNNTGARILPPAQHPLIWYPAGPSEKFPEMGAGGMSAFAGAVYRYNENTVGPHGLPARYDGRLFIMEFMRQWIKEVELDDEGHLLEINPFLSEMTFLRPFDMDIGPEGAIYLIEWGESYEGWFNDQARIVRIEHHGTTGRPPVAVAKADQTSGPAPLTVQFTGAASHSRNENTSVAYAWDFDGDDRTDATGANPTFTYEEAGNHTAKLVITDAAGSSSTEVDLSVGNTAPEITIDWPVEGGIIDMDEAVTYRLSVDDAEQETIRDQDVRVQPQLVHDSHWHLLEQQTGSTGTFEIDSNARHLFLENLYAKLSVSYTDDGGDRTEPLTSEKEIVLQPRRKDAAHVTAIHGAVRTVEGDVRARDTVETFLDVKNDDYVSYAPVNLRNINAITFRAAPQAGGTIEARLDAPDGELLGKASVEAASTTASDVTDDEDVYHWQEVTMPVTDPGRPFSLYLVFRGPNADQDQLMRLDWLAFNGPGMMK